jgi:hypothetical protein
LLLLIGIVIAKLWVTSHKYSNFNLPLNPIVPQGGRYCTSGLREHSVSACKALRLNNRSVGIFGCKPSLLRWQVQLTSLLESCSFTSSDLSFPEC